MPNPDNAIFLCYRRDDANPAAYGIYERLKVAFGERGVFLDHYGFRGGEDWRVKTKPVLEQARAVVVIINKDWITIGKSRFRDADDPVRQELELSLARDDLLVIPVTIDRTPAPGKSDVEAFRQAGGDGLADLLAGLFAKTMLKVRFDRDFEPDIQQLIRRLDEVSGIDQVGAATSFDAGGLQLIRPWDITAPRPAHRPDDVRASDLWILQPKYRAIPLVGRERDLKDLREWLNSEPTISARLLVGRAGAGKTRLAFEFIWEVFCERGDLWDCGVAVGESLRQPRDWNAWIWRRPTLLMLDYAHALEESVNRMFLALTRKAQDRNLPRLRILLLEREASAEEGWFRRLIEMESSVGGGPVRDLFEPPAPVPLHRLDTPALRREVIHSTLAMASEHDGQPSPALPSEGQNSRFDRQILDPQWSDPLYLMMAALVARRRYLHAGAKGSELLDAMTLNRVDLALEVAKHERRRLEQFAEGTGGTASRLVCHMAVCVTLCGGLTAEGARRAVEEEAAALGLAWPAGPGDIAMLLHRALPVDDEAVASVQPDIVAEAFVLDTLRHEELNRQAQRETVLRAARRNHARVAATLFHAFQNFADDDQRTSDLLDWIGAPRFGGLERKPGLASRYRGGAPAPNHEAPGECGPRHTSSVQRDARSTCSRRRSASGSASSLGLPTIWPTGSARWDGVRRPWSRQRKPSTFEGLWRSKIPTPSGPIWQVRWGCMVRSAKQTGKTRARRLAFETQSRC